MNPSETIMGEQPSWAGPFTFDPEPANGYWVYVGGDGVIRLGEQIHEAIERAGYTLVKTGPSAAVD